MSILLKQPKPFAQWLKESRTRRGLTMEALADLADTTQAMVSSLERGTRNPSRDMVQKLAAALAANNGEWASQRMLNEGMKAAGFTNEVEYDSDPDFQLITEAWSGANATGKRAMKSAAELALELSRESSIGKRAD